MRLPDLLTPLRHPPFRRQFLAQAISATGSSLAPVAMAFGVLAATGSARDLGVVLAAYSVPMLVLMLVGGVWADRLPRHRLMATADSIRGLTQTTFGILLITGHPPLWTMVVLQAVAGAAQAFGNPATIGLTQATAPPEARQQANALLSLTRDLAFIAGPLIAGGLTISVGPGWALVLDGGTFFVSAWLLSGLRLAAAPRTPKRFWTDLREGWRAVASREWLWASVIYFAFFNLVFAVFLVLGPAQLAGAPNGALGWGVVSAGLSLGTLSGNALALRLRPRLLLRWTRLMEFLAIPMILALAWRAPVPVLAVAAFLMGVTMSFPDALWFTALQQEVPEDTISRVSSFDFLGSFLSRPVGFLLAGALVAAGTTASLVGIAVVFAVVTLATLLSPGVWSLARRTEVPGPVGAQASAGI